MRNEIIEGKIHVVQEIPQNCETIIHVHVYVHVGMVCINYAT